MKRLILLMKVFLQSTNQELLKGGFTLELQTLMETSVGNF